MKNILTSSLFIIAFLSGCATRPVKLVSPPKADRLELLKKSLVSKTEFGIPLDESENLAKDYLLALDAERSGETKIACNLFSDLAEKKSLPIKEAALIHTLADCDLSTSYLEEVWSETKVPTYLKDSYFEYSRVLAAKANMPAYEAEFSFALIPYKTIQSEKVKLITRAIAIAEKLGDLEKLKLYNEKLKEISPLHNTEITDKNIYSVARDFEANRKFSKARELYKQIIDGNFPLEEKVKAYNSYRTTYKVERDLKTFLAKTYEMESFLKGELNKNPNDQKTSEAWTDSKIALSRAVWTNHQNADARKILDDLITSKLGNQNQRATAQYVYGSLHLENKENSEALKRFEKANAFKVTDNALLENIQWAIVWNYYLLKNDSKVVSFSDNFAKKSTNQNFVAKLNYWKAKSLLRLGKKEEANAVFTSVSQADPFGYYGIISTINLKKPLQPISSQSISTESTGNQTLDWLVAVGETNFSQKFLKGIDSQFKTYKEREKEMPLYFLTGWYQGGMRQIYNFKPGDRNAMTEKYINVVFPTPYYNTVDSMASKYNIPKELIYAIARQESAFVPSERSWADAFGLMQMIPEKASELSKKYAITYHNYNDLYNPEINIEMGAALLKNLREKFQYKFAQSVAAYNASDEVIRIWEKERFNGNYFEFIEMIPYEETRNYIKLVFRNFITYKRISSKEEFMLDENFFAKTF